MNSKDIMIVDYNNLYGLITAPYYKFANNTFLTFSDFACITVTFTDYVRFIIDQLHSSNQYDITFFNEDKKLYDIALELEPILSVLDKAIPHILKVPNSDDETSIKLESYLDNINQNHKLGYNVIELYYSYLVTMAQLQVVYCYTILTKNSSTLSTPARPFKIIPSIGAVLNALNEDSANTNLQFIAEIRDMPTDIPSIPHALIDKFPLGEFYRDATLIMIEQDDKVKRIVPNILVNIESYAHDLPANVRTNILKILDNACAILYIASKVKEDNIMYVLDNNIESMLQ